MINMRIYQLSKAPIKKGTRVIVRADFDVAIKSGKVADDFRIRKVMPTLKYLLQKGASLRIISHLDRPGGKKVSGLSMAPVRRHLQGLLKKEIIFIADPLSEKAFAEFNSSRQILFFENIRFWPGEEKNDPKFAKKLARWGDIYVNEAFADSHRAHASITQIAKYLPSFAGLNLEKELFYLGKMLKSPKRPYVAAIGGIKLETKLPLVKKFLREADGVLLGSGLGRFGKSGAKNLYAPLDYITDKKGNNVDIGPKTISRFTELVKDAKTVVWNGPLGNTPNFPRGTQAFAKAVGHLSAVKIVGGGDTILALEKYGLLRNFTHVSAGGGAMLEFLAGKKLPGIEALRQ